MDGGNRRSMRSMRRLKPASAVASPNAPFAIRPWINARAAWVSRSTFRTLGLERAAHGRKRARRSTATASFRSPCGAAPTPVPPNGYWPAPDLHRPECSSGSALRGGSPTCITGTIDKHRRNGHQDDQHHGDPHDLSLDRQPDHGAIHFKEWPSLKSCRRFHQMDTKQALRLIHINALLSQNVLLAAFASVCPFD